MENEKKKEENLLKIILELKLCNHEEPRGIGYN